MQRTSARPPLWVHGFRAFLGVVFFSAGVSKLVPGYPVIIGPVWLIERLEPYGLGLYGEFIAVSEAAIGLLLLSRRLATVGAIMLVPMLINILVVTISLSWQGTPYVLAFLLLLNGALLAYDYPRWRGLLMNPAAARTPATIVAKSPGFDPGWWTILAVLLVSPVIVPRGFGLLYLLLLSVLIALGLRYLSGSPEAPLRLDSSAADAASADRGLTSPPR